MNTIKGWMPRQEYERLLKDIEEPFPHYGKDKNFDFIIYKTKGKRSDWLEWDWPPVKVQITIKKL